MEPGKKYYSSEFPVLLYLYIKNNACISHFLKESLTSKYTFWGKGDVIKGNKDVFIATQISFKCHLKWTVTGEMYISIHPTASFIANH